MTAEHPSSGDALAADSSVIEINVRELNQLFESLDPSPFHEKSLDRNAHEYIVSTARDLTDRAPAALIIYLAQPVGLPDEAHVLGDAIRLYFARRADTARRQLRQSMRRGWLNLVVGLTLLVSSVVVGQLIARRMGQGPLATVIRESLLIGGWVAMWRPMDFFLYELWIMRRELRIYEWLGRASVRIVYAAAPRHTIARAAGNGEPVAERRS